MRKDEDQLTQAILALASQYGRYGYRRITALLQQAGWNVGRDRVQCIWRREGFQRLRRTPRRAEAEWPRRSARHFHFSAALSTSTEGEVVTLA